MGCDSRCPVSLSLQEETTEFNFPHSSFKKLVNGLNVLIIIYIYDPVLRPPGPPNGMGPPPPMFSFGLGFYVDIA